MKKKLREEVHQFAKKILQEETEGQNLELLQQQARQLYEKLTVAVYAEKGTTAEREVQKPMQATDSKTYDTYMEAEDPVPVERANYKESLAEPLIEKIKDIVAQMPSETQKIDDLLEEIMLPKPPEPKKEAPKTDLEDFASHYKETPTFERKEARKQPEPPSEKASEQPQEKKPKSTLNQGQKKPKSLNEKLNKNLAIGLNDRLAFTKHLFNQNTEEYNRVISQLTTMNSFEEAKSFIDTMVKPDYNWEGKEPHVARFLHLLEKKFD